MPSDTTAKQNTIIWSAAGGVILLLCGIIGWLVNGKDVAILNSIKDLKTTQEKWHDEGIQSDMKVMESITKLCDRVGGVEGRVSNLEIFIQMPFSQRKDLFDSFRGKIPKPKDMP